MADGVAPLTTRADPALVKALARAFRYQRMLNQGRYASITEMADAERLDRGYMGRLLQLTLLAPDLVESILNGLQPNAIALSTLTNQIPAEWAAQIACTAQPSGPHDPSATQEIRQAPAAMF
jgi:hypothetical protein